LPEGACYGMLRLAGREMRSAPVGGTRRQIGQNGAYVVVVIPSVSEESRTKHPDRWYDEILQLASARFRMTDTWRTNRFSTVSRIPVVTVTLNEVKGLDVNP